MTELKITKFSPKPYDYNVEVETGFNILFSTIDNSSQYLVVLVKNEQESNIFYYLLDKKGNIISPSDRKKELINNPEIEIEYFNNHFRIERFRDIDMKTGAEIFMDTLYQDGKLVSTKESIAFSFNFIPIKDIHSGFMDELKQEKQRKYLYQKMNKKERLGYWLMYALQSSREGMKVDISFLKKKYPDIELYIDDMLEALMSYEMTDDKVYVKNTYFVTTR